MEFQANATFFDYAHYGRGSGKITVSGTRPVGKSGCRAYRRFYFDWRFKDDYENKSYRDDFCCLPCDGVLTGFFCVPYADCR